MKAWFLSDIHLNDLDERNGQILLRFFRSILYRDIEATHIFLLGDIFDLWLADHEYFIEKYRPLIDLLKKLKEQGVEVYFFEGNHDFHLKNYWQEKIGITVYTEEAYFQVGSYKIRAEHGDLMNPDDLDYLRWRKFVRSPFMKFVVFSLPGRLASYIGEKLSSASRRRHQSYSDFDQNDAKKLIRTYAQKLCKNAPSFDYLFTGHVHVRDEYQFEFSDKKICSVNLGFWGEDPQVYCLTEDGGQFLHLESVGEFLI